MVGPHSHGAGAARGYTLTELLTVIGVLAILSAMALGIFAALPGRLAHETAEASVRALLRRARTAALESRAPAQVTFAGRRVEARAWATLALFRFEDAPPGDEPTSLTTLGARGVVGRASGVTAGPGRLGNALFFEAPGACVDLGDLPAFSVRDGIKVEAWVQPADYAPLRDPDAAGAGMARAPRPPSPGSGPDGPFEFEIAAKGDAWFLRVREDYALVGGVRGPGAKRAAVRETAPGALVPGRWTEVALVFDGEDLQLLVGGLRRDLPPPEGAPPPPRDLAQTPQSLTISSPSAGLSFLGGIDEVSISGIVAEEAIELADDVALEAPPAVRFDARGGLDPLFHDGPVRVAIARIESQGGRGPAPRTATARVIDIERSGALR